jgi:hypothetical protein
MSLERLQRLNLFKGLSFSAIFVIIAFIIFIGLVDRSILHLSFFEENTQYSSLTRNVFLAVMLSALVTQSIFIYKIYVDTLALRKTKFKNLYLIPLICHFLNLALIAILITQIFYESKYSKFLILFTIWINTSIGISILAILAYRFILWLRESTKKSSVVIMYVGSIILFIILNATILLYFTLGYRVGLSYITSNTEPSLIFSSPHYELSVLISILGIFSFLVLWTSSILLLTYGREKIKKKYILIIGASLAIFLSHYAFLLGFSSLRLTNFNMFHDVYAIMTTISFPLGGIFFGFTFWILARNIDVYKDNDPRYKEELARIKQSMYFTSIGIILLILSASPLDITRLPYPPFGMVSFTFMNIGALSFFLGIYNLATAIGGSSHFRRRLAKSEFLFSIGSSQDQLSKRTSIVQLLKTFKNRLLETETDEEEVDKEYVKYLVAERKKSIQNSDIVTFSRNQTPLGRSWENWVELWWQWYFSHSKESILVNDSKSEFSDKNKLHESVRFLFGNFDSKVEKDFDIPKDTAIFFPIISDIISFATYPQLKTVSDLNAYSKAEIDRTKIISAKIDGNEIPNLNSYRVHSNLFHIGIIDKSKKDLKTETLAVSDGFWLFIKPLRPGKHKLEYSVEILEFDRSENYENISEADTRNRRKFCLEVIYNLKIG